MREPRKRQVLLAIDALFGLLLLLVAFGAPLPWSRPSDSHQPAATPSTTAEQVARFGALWQPGQTTGFALAADGGMALVDRGRGCDAMAPHLYALRRRALLLRQLNHYMSWSPRYLERRA